jgi:bifunctional DNA primase/polymerase-like protein
MDKTQLTFALDAHRRGWHIFPCEPGEKQGALLYPGQDKPWRIKWYETATNDINQIIQWWTARPDYNIGVSAKKSGLLIVDCDVPKDMTYGSDGWDQFQYLCSKRGVDWEDTVDTYQVETPSKGVHLYYEWPPSVQASQASLDDLLDVRTNGGEKGGYVVGAGSRTGAGWYHVINPAPVKMAPKWLIEECKWREPVKAMAAPFTRPHAISTTGLHDTVRKAAEGNRNNALHWAVAQAAEEQPELTVDELFDEFVDDAVEAGLTMVEIRGTVASGYRRAHYR